MQGTQGDNVAWLVDVLAQTNSPERPSKPPVWWALVRFDPNYPAESATWGYPISLYETREQAETVLKGNPTTGARRYAVVQVARLS